ncbi:MAG: TIGR04372 family glycosyltransferase [Candidatus Omnitrophota bacterium]|nr:MAG: TIGR04372 family glycosyltransferase [Candidatus Omnitrophota bacterium]
MWERTGKLRISPFAKFTHTLDRVNRLLPGGKPHTILTPDMDFYGLRAATKPYLSFTPEEERLGREELRKLGISGGRPFICFHARDSAYLRDAYPDYNWRYQDCRDSSIHNYIPAAEELAREGYFMVRMGAIVKEALKTKNPMIIDYAVKGRTDFLDIYLGAKCRFFICDGSGASSIPMAFRRPIVWVNYVQLEFIPIWGIQDLFIPRKLWLRKERRFLTLSEIINSDIKRFFSEQYEQLGIEVVENTPEEIRVVALEMDERLKGTYKTTGEDEELQRRFWSVYKERWPHRKILSRIGAEFLRQNLEFLE